MIGATVRIPLVHVAAGLLIAGGGASVVGYAGGRLGLDVALILAALGLTVAVVPSLYFRRRLAEPLDHMRDVLHMTRNDGDLARRVIVPPTSAVAPAAAAYNELMATFQGIITRILFNSNQLAQAADQLIVEARDTRSSSEQQNAAAESAAIACAEMAGGMNDAAERAEETARIALAAREHSSRGAAIVLDAAAEIERIATSVEQSAQVVAALGERSTQISGIVKVIHGIADQTNLLALNAAIEAARAGEQGRGFAVVADEVRKLAERTTAATTEISSVIAAIQSETSHAILTIKAGSVQAANGAQLANQAAEALGQIKEGAQETLDKVTSIAQTMHEQSEKTKTVAEHVSSIMGLADHNSECSKNALAEANQLDYLAMNLEEIGTIFKLGPAGEQAMKVHERMPSVVQSMAKTLSDAFSDAVDRGQIRLDDLFDQNYVPIANTRPQKFHTRFDGFCDKLLPPIQEPVLDGNAAAAYAIACDRRGYVPTHNSRYSQPLTGDEKKDFVGNRTKRVFADPVGKRCGDHEIPFLLQTYRRDTGEIMHDISAPVYVKGRHWGGVRIGYRTE
ncbi:MAG: methyl-accepting chemotaxis protein [Rhodocyclales bacterium]|nr:methyl-accepting chemotaxis protein [Rhodocyclales bacterium]